MTILDTLRNLWYGTARPTDDVEAPESPCSETVILSDGSVGLAARRKHLFRGAEYCVRGCSTRNPKWRAPQEQETA